MNKIEQYRHVLKELPRENWETFLLKESRLPGPRANLELLAAVMQVGDEGQFEHWLRQDALHSPFNVAEEFLSLCGVTGQGKLLAEGRTEVLEKLRRYAADSRWRMREGVCIALQHWGEVDMSGLLKEMALWSQGNLWEQRAAVAALCEPSLLEKEEYARRVLDILDQITDSIKFVEDRKSEAFRVLRKGLGYCWSVAVVALPVEGKDRMEKWFSSQDKAVLWIMRENLGKKRLQRMDAEWVRQWRAVVS